MAETPGERLHVWGMRLPIIADLGDGWFLVGHPNGEAIATEDSLWDLESAAGAEPKTDALDGPEDAEAEKAALPYEVRRAALKAYGDWAWPLVKGHLSFAGWNPRGAAEQEHGG
jgi:hypothetical protein